MYVQRIKKKKKTSEKKMTTCFNTNKPSLFSKVLVASTDFKENLGNIEQLLEKNINKELKKEIKIKK